MPTDHHLHLAIEEDRSEILRSINAMGTCLTRGSGTWIRLSVLVHQSLALSSHCTAIDSLSASSRPGKKETLVLAS